MNLKTAYAADGSGPLAKYFVGTAPTKTIVTSLEIIGYILTQLYSSAPYYSYLDACLLALEVLQRKTKDICSFAPTKTGVTSLERPG